MSIRIEVVNVSAPVFSPTAKGGYNTIEVAYKGQDGKVTGKKLLDFASPQAYNSLKGAAFGQVFLVETSKRQGKDGKDYIYWDKVEADSSAPAEVVSQSNDSTPSAGAGPVSGGRPAGRSTGYTGGADRKTYETPEERAVKQAIITRQATLNSAIAYLTGQGGAFGPEQVLAVAKQFQLFVMDDLGELSAAVKQATKE